jgi:hypothetical protein
VGLLGNTYDKHKVSSQLGHKVIVAIPVSLSFSVQLQADFTSKKIRLMGARGHLQKLDFFEIV